METIKRGSTGDAVRVLQSLLGIAVDGVFGPKTEQIVKQYQKANKLVDDGVVGPKTWELLQKANITIVDGHINTHITRSPNRKIKYISIHYTAGSTSKKGTALSVRNVFLQRSASADFVVDDDTIVQINPDLRNYYCWAVGDRKNPYTGGGSLYKNANNKNTISIEICSNLKKSASAAFPNHDGWYFTDKSLDNAAKLVRYLMKMFNVPKSNVVRHYDITGKLCPGIVGWNNANVYDANGKATVKKSNSDAWMVFWSII